MRIAHTADIHIRSLSRHDEYREVLGAFVRDCAAQRVDHIFVGGDIFHTKCSGISPEYIDFLSWWLTEMSKVAEVHLILGNHDGNLVNLSRQDAVSPIVDALSNPRVHLYKKSGVYNFSPGFNFCIFSVFDEEGWKNIEPQPESINIAAYHGPVRGSSTETGWDVEEGLTADYFEKYDFCFLGDIHKPQFLGYKNQKPWIAYPGTPVQQNYAEQIEHGYLLWDIQKKDDWSVVTRLLPNPKPFVTIDWKDDLSTTLQEAKKHSKDSRFRIRAQVQVSQDDIYRISEALKTSMSATEVTFKSDYQVDKEIVKSKSASVEKSNLRSIDTIVNLLKDYHSDSNLSQKDIDMMSDQAKNYLSSAASSEDSSRSSTWSIRHLKWDNLFAYGENNSINFEKMNGVVGIFGSNRVGKSSIVGTLMYSLFNTTDRGPVKNINVCNIRKPYCSSKVILDHNGKTYILERQTTKSANKKGVVTASTSLNLFKMREDGDVEDMCGEQRNDTEKTVRSLFGNAEDFLMTSLSAQGETNQFISQGSSKRRSLLTKFLDLDIFDKMNDLAAKDANGIKSQLKNFPDRNWEEVKSQNEGLVSSHTNLMKSLTEKIEESQSVLNLLHQELNSHKSSFVTQKDIDVQKSKVFDLEAKFTENLITSSSLESNIQELMTKTSSVRSLLDSIDVDSIKNKLDSQKKMESSILELKHVHEKELSTLSHQKKSLKILDEVPCEDNFPTCKFIKDAHENKSKILAQEEKTRSLIESLDSARRNFESIKLENLEEKISKHSRATDLLLKLDVEISKKEVELERVRSSISSIESTLSESKKRLKDLEDAYKNDENLEVVSIKSKIEDLSLKIRSWNEERISSASMHGKILSNIEKIEEEKKQRDSLLERLRIHELISSAFSKKGIPLLVTKSQLPLINLEISKILQGIVDFSIEVEADEDSDFLEIYINYGDSRRIIELCSGMEKTIASLALRVAMANISSLPKPDFFIIDEGFGTLDNAGVEACSRLLVSLKRYFKIIFVITHVDGIKDAADHIIEITKSEKDSRVEFE